MAADDASGDLKQWGSPTFRSGSRASLVELPSPEVAPVDEAGAWADLEKMRVTGRSVSEALIPAIRRTLTIACRGHVIRITTRLRCTGIIRQA